MPFWNAHTLVFRPTFALSRAKSNYSRTSTKCTGKSNYSRTYARQGVGAVIVMVTYLKYVGAPTIPFLRERRRSQTQRFREEREIPRPARDDGIEKGKRCSTRLEWRCLFFWGFGRFTWPSGGAKAGDRINVNAEEERSNRVVAQSELTLP